MTTLLESAGTAVWRASWQAAALALVVLIVVRVLRERLAPRWRHVLWSLVVLRLLVVAIPASPWSAFNLVCLVPELTDRLVASYESVPRSAPEARAVERAAQPESDRHTTVVASPRDESPVANPPAQAAGVPAISSAAPTGSGPEIDPSEYRPSRAPSLVRILSVAWLAGILLVGLQLLCAALVLRRRLSACRPVTDASVLEVLDQTRRQLGLRRRPALLVTPESLSPCIAGAWRPRVIVPESIITDALGDRIRHVLAHELAHLARGDLWTNWLLLVARTLHWFNPAAWWTIREMQAECETACDEMAVAALGEADRSAYASTLIDLAWSMAPSGMAPGMVGMISSNRRLKTRIERLAKGPAARAIRSPVVAAVVLAIALAGLTDAMPAAAARPSTSESTASLEEGQGTEGTTITLRGRCTDHVDRSAVAGARVRLFKAEGRTAPIVEVATSVADADGRFVFPGLTPPRPDDPIDPLLYLVFAESDERPIGAGGIWGGREGEGESIDVRFLRERTTLAGRVLDADGQLVAGATVAQWAIDGRAFPGILSGTTGADGRFQIRRIPYYDWIRPGSEDSSGGLSFSVSHPDHPETTIQVRELPRNITVKLPAGCRVTGMVTDGVTARPAAGVLVLAERLGEYSETPAYTDAAGRFSMVLPEDRYNFSVRARDRVCVSVTDRECLAGQRVELPPLTLISGGFIAGRVVNASTGQPIAVTEQGRPIEIGLIGPSKPLGKVVAPSRMATVDRDGRFRLRAAPGANFPYFVNFHGDRMAWNTSQQPAVVVKQGETTEYDMLVTPKVPPAERLKIAQRLVASLPPDPSERTARILLEFRKLNHTVDETELWCSLMRELVAVGRDAVPILSAELDATTENRMLRRLGFAARAIGDPRVAPALIRAIPKTLLPSSSDYGLIVADGALAQFMQKYDLSEGQGGTYFDLGRPEREILGALHKLTGQDFDDLGFLGLSRSEDPRRQWYQRQIFNRQARRWQAWWEAHGREFTEDADYQKVHVKIDDAPPPARADGLGPNARLGDGVIGETLSPAIQGGQYTDHFYDLDTGAQPRWPAHIPRDEARLDSKQLADWAAENGVDLMCVTHRAADGTETFVLRSFGLKAWEISPRDLRNLDRLVASGTLPNGHEVGELLMHYDEATKRLVPDANAAFLYVTREGCLGLIETTDRVVRTADLTGSAGGPPAGVGFFLGVRCNLKSIIP